jgi:hypothetical protein
MLSASFTAAKKNIKAERNTVDILIKKRYNTLTV